MSTQPLLSLQDVGVGFRRGRHVVRVLTSVSFELYPGETVSVLAQRAQGKTTLLRVAAGMGRPASGRVLFAGEDVWKLSDERRSRLLASEIGWVAPREPDVDLPVLDHVALPALGARGRRDAYRHARELLRRVGVAECASQHWSSLADWERALVAIAHGFAREPRLLLVDDLTTTLGIDEADEVSGLLASLAHERGAAMIAGVGDSSATKHFDRLGSLAAGELLMPAAPRRRTTNVIDLHGAGTQLGGAGRGASA